ncbi:MAG: TadE/TadG family type IV pilus assembly protein [Bdellovibrionales bacterium]
MTRLRDRGMSGCVRRLVAAFCRYRTDCEGAAAVEFSLVALPFLLMIFGTMEAGRIVMAMNSVEYAIEETSRYAALNVGLGDEAFQDYAEARLAEMFVRGDDLQITSSTQTSNNVDFVEIRGQYSIESMVGAFLPGGFGSFDFDFSARKPVIE